MHLTKHHGLGNDFLIHLVAPGDDITPSGELAVQLCDRSSGPLGGADGLIYATGFDNVDFGDGKMLQGFDRIMHLYNSDGSRAEMSGNGIRCLAQAIARSESKDEADLVVSTDAGRRDLQVRPGPDSSTSLVRVGMGPVKPGPDFDPSRIVNIVGPSATGKIASADLGNPHLVIEVTDPQLIDLAATGPAVEAEFGDGVNVHFVRATNRTHLELRVWERGAGITQACGTGACAATSAAHGWDLTDAAVDVAMPGGAAHVELVDDEVVLTGPAVFTGEVDVPVPAMET